MSDHFDLIVLGSGTTAFAIVSLLVRCANCQRSVLGSQA
jgi:hypothetical protein